MFLGSGVENSVEYYGVFGGGVTDGYLRETALGLDLPGLPVS